MRVNGVVPVRRFVAGLSAFLLTAAAVLAAAVTGSPARAAGGSWGAGQYPYLDGTICTRSVTVPGQPAQSTIPYASWDTGTGTPAYLMQPVTSTGVIDSAVPPLPALGAVSSTDVFPGMYGFTSDADIAAFAALLGSGGSAQAIASAVYARFGQTVPDCPIGDDGLPQQSAALAGPYRVDVRSERSTVDLGASTAVTATVTGGVGQPIPGLTVTFSSDIAELAAPTVTTDAAGQASTTFQVATGTPANSLSLSAEIAVPTGLRVLTVQTQPSATNPTGAAVPAIALADPSPVRATAQVGIDTTANPVLRATASVQGVALGDAFAASASVTGLRGHTASATFTIYGPVPPASDGSCVGARFSSQIPVAARTDTVTVAGDRSFSAAGWTPSRVGCYLTVAHLETVDANPNVSADSGFGAASAIVTVIDSRGAFAIGGAVVGRNGLTATITGSGAAAQQATGRATLRGPVRPKADGSCDVDFAKAARRTVIAEPTQAAIQGSAGGEPSEPPATVLRLTVPPVDQGGCYQWTPSLSVQVPGAGSIAVPVDGGARTVLVLAPTVSVSVDQAWTTTPGTVTAQVSVAGAYGQPAHVALGLRYVPMPQLGCRYADFDAAKSGPAGPATPLPEGKDSVAVTTGAMTRPGCYSPTVTLSLDADPDITATGGRPTSANTIAAGVALTNLSTGASALPGGSKGQSQARALIALGALLGVQLLLAAVVAVQAWRRRGRRPSPRPHADGLLGLQ